MSLLHSFIITSLTGLSTLIGYLFIYIKINKNNINKFIELCLAISISIMIGISLTDLIPCSFSYLLLKYSLLSSITILLSFILIGYLIIYIFNKIINNESSLYKIGILSMLSLFLHNLPEGIITFLGSAQNPTLGIKIATAIMLHNMPEGLIIAIPIYYSTHNKKKAFFYTFFSSFSELLGAIIAYLFLYKYINNYLISIILLFVSGIMISLSIEELFPKAIKYNYNKYLYLGFIIGILFLLINYFLF